MAILPVPENRIVIDGVERELYCKEECKHRDCAAWRAFFSNPCPLCGKPLEPGQGYYNVPGTKGTQGEHAVCRLELIEIEKVFTGYEIDDLLRESPEIMCAEAAVDGHPLNLDRVKAFIASRYQEALENDEFFELGIPEPADVPDWLKALVMVGAETGAGSGFES